MKVRDKYIILRSNLNQTCACFIETLITMIAVLHHAIPSHYKDRLCVILLCRMMSVDERENANS